MASGPDSEAIYVAIIFAQDAEIRAREEADPTFVYARRELLLGEDLRVKRKMTTPPVAYQKIAPPYGDRLERIAGRYGLPFRRPSWHAAWRWCKFYGIES